MYSVQEIQFTWIFNNEKKNCLFVLLSMWCFHGIVIGQNDCLEATNRHLGRSKRKMNSKIRSNVSSLIETLWGDRRPDATVRHRYLSFKGTGISLEIWDWPRGGGGGYAHLKNHFPISLRWWVGLIFPSITGLCGEWTIYKDLSVMNCWPVIM